MQYQQLRLYVTIYDIFSEEIYFLYIMSGFTDYLWYI